MAYANGRIPESELSETYLYYPGTTNGRQLLASVAPYAEAMATAFYLHFRKPLYATDGYRDYATQVRLKREKGPYAATPGESNHGLGKALDLASGVNSFGSAEHKWLRANAHRWGFEHPIWAHDGYSGNGMDEAWHWEFVGGGTADGRFKRAGANGLGIGDSGPAVREVQELLKDAGYSDLVADSDFGFATAARVYWFQRREGLTRDGVVGPATLARLKGDDDKKGVLMALKDWEQEELLRKVREIHSGEYPKIDNPFVEGKKFTLRTTLKSFISRLDRLEKAVNGLLGK